MFCPNFGLLTVFFFNYHKFLGNISAGLQPLENGKDFAPRDMANLLEEKFIEPISSVTENSTELLYAKNKTRKLQ